MIGTSSRRLIASTSQNKFLDNSKIKIPPVLAGGIFCAGTDIVRYGIYSYPYHSGNTTSQVYILTAVTIKQTASIKARGVITYFSFLLGEMKFITVFTAKNPPNT